MKLLLTRPVDLGRGKVSYFGDVQIAGQRVFFLAANGREVAIIAGLKEPGKRSFREGNRLRFEYRAWPDGALKPGEAALVERFIIRLLRREDSMARDIAAREHEPVLGGALQVSSADTIDTIVITNPTDKSQPPQAIPIHIAERTRFTLQLMHWSAMVDLDPPPTDITALGRIQECILTVMTSHLLGIPLPVADTVVQKKTRNPAFAYFDLARPESNQQTIQHLQVTSDEHFVVSIEVPSKCDNHCLFCAVTGCDGPAKPIPEDHDILTRAV